MSAPGRTGRVSGTTRALGHPGHGAGPITGRVVGVDSIDADAFEALVAEALATIPDALRSALDNVAIIVDDQSPPGPLYGLYEGVPLTKRGTYAGASPDRITLFLATICQSASTTEDLARRRCPAS